MPQLGLVPIFRAVDSNGNPLASARLYTFLTGTLTAAPTYTTSALSVSHGAYVQADANGLFPAFYLDPTVIYRVQLRVSPYSAAVSGQDYDPINSLTLSSIQFLQQGAGAVARTAQDKLEEYPLSPEDFGAVGSGTVDDSAALARTFTAAMALGMSIQYGADATYGIGASGWTGLDITLTRDLEIDGNGATVKLLFAASQAAIAGSVLPAIKIDGTAAKFGLKIRNLKVNHNLIREPIFAPYRCTLDIEGCYAYGGDIGSGGIGDASIFIYANACTGRYCYNDSKNCPFPFYGGHTDAAMFCTDLVMIGNTGTEFHVSGSSTYRGDPYNGVVHGMTMANNVWSNFFGVGFSGVAANSTVCKNIHVHDNVLTDFTGSGVQSDNFGAISSTGFNIHDNIINDAVAAAVPLYFPQITDSQISNNRGVNCRSAIVVDNAAGSVTISGNNFALGTSTPAGIGISLVGQLSTITEVDVLNNRMEDFAVNIYVGGAGNAVSNINVIGNTTLGGANGLRIDDTATGIWVDANDFAGGHTLDINNTATNGQAGVMFGQNKFTTAAGVAQVLPVAQPTPTAKAADATLTIAELLTGIVTATSASAVALTLPTGALTDAGMGAFAIGQSFEWNVINLGSGLGAVTMTAGADHTYVGAAVVAISTSAQFRSRKTATNTFITYRIA